MQVYGSKKGLGWAGVSLMAALMLSSAALAQDAGDGADETTIEGEEFYPPDGGLFVIDPICDACWGEPLEELYVVDEEVVGDGIGDGEILIYEGPADCGEQGCEGTLLSGEFDGGLLGNPEIYYNMAGGDLPSDLSPEAAPAVRGSHSAAMRGGPDLCATPARELVWLCTLLGGNTLSE
jgi:hypothetical protein